MINTILGQVRVVQRGQRLRIMLDKMSVMVEIRGTDPAREAVILQQMTEFIVIDSEAEEEVEEKEDSAEKKEISSVIKKSKCGHQESFSSVFKAKKMSVEQAHPYICYISNTAVFTDSIVVAKIVLLKTSFQASKRCDETPIAVQVKHDDKVPPGAIMMHDTLLRLKGIQIGSRIFLRLLQVQPQSVQKSITLISTQNMTSENRKAFDDLISTEKKCFFPSPSIFDLKGSVVQIESDVIDCDFLFLEASNYKLKTKTVETLPIEFKTEAVMSTNHDQSLKLHREPKYQFEKIEQCRKYLSKLPHSRRHFNILVTGNSGIGKTVFVKSLASILSEKESAHWTVRVINCVTLKGKKSEACITQIRTCLEELDHLCPGILILDNLDSVSGAEEEDRPDDTSACLSSWLLGVLQHPERFLKVAVIVTAKSSFSLHKLFQSTRGSIPFRKHVSLTAPTTDEVEALLKFYTNNESLKLSPEILTSLEGFYPSDLRRLVDLVLTSHDQWSPEACELELRHYVPASKWGEDLKPKSLKRLEDVGGLHEARRSLIQVLMWPSQYPRQGCQQSFNIVLISCI